MWRFVLISFAFLAFAFYQLSGGADYAPAPNSLQAWAKYGHKRPVARPVQTNVIELATNLVPESLTQTTRTVTSLAELERNVQVARPSVGFDTVAREMVAQLNAPEPEISEPVTPIDFEDALIQARFEDVPSLSQPASVMTAIESVARIRPERTDPTNVIFRELDLRTVVGDVVNVRQGPGTGHPKVASLLKDDQVTVLQENGDGWIEVSVVGTGEVGWMADWLVTSRN